MIATLLGIGAVALKWVGGGAGILGLLSGVLRIPFVSGLVSAIPLVGPFFTEAAKVFLGWLDAAVRFIARACLALLEAVSGRPIIAVPILLALWGQQLYFEHWAFRSWTPPPAPTVSAPARETEPVPRSLLGDLFGPSVTTEVSGGKTPAKQQTQRKRAPPRCDSPLDGCWWDRVVGG